MLVHTSFRKVVYGITMYQYQMFRLRPPTGVAQANTKGLMQLGSRASIRAIPVLCFASQGLITIGPEENKGGLHVIDM